MAQRISRAKQSIRAAGVGFEMPPEPERAERLRVVLHVLYLIFNEGYIASSGPDLQRGELTREAIRLTRAVHALLPDDGEVAGLLALMLLTDARRPARTRADGTLIALAEQDRSLWNRAYIEEGTALITDALAHATLGPYQLQAAIAAVHDEAPSAQDTDWPQILALYELLARVAPNPMVTLNHAVAVAMVARPARRARAARHARRRRPHGRPPPPRRGPRPPARDGRRPRRRPRRLPRRGAAHDQPPRAALSRGPRRAARVGAPRGQHEPHARDPVAPRAAEHGVCGLQAGECGRLDAARRSGRCRSSRRRGRGCRIRSRRPGAGTRSLPGAHCT